MKEYSEIDIKQEFPINSIWSTEWGNLIVVDAAADYDGMGYIVEFKFPNGNKILIHPYFVGERIY